MKCHGKCHLSKKFIEETKRDESGKNSMKEITETSPFIQNNGQLFKAHSQTGSGSWFHYVLKTTEKRNIAFFHPPQNYNDTKVL